MYVVSQAGLVLTVYIDVTVLTTAFVARSMVTARAAFVKAVDLAFNRPTDSNLPYLAYGEAAYAVDASLKTCFVSELAENSTWFVELKEASWVNTVSVFVVTGKWKTYNIQISVTTLHINPKDS
ncbi:hypothetical protein BaRGS_00024020 [Batillaria attramentaria]|uniref:Uncharacterized protein n=1 Tax=Batillaria attramentaria TaxID=370345 RepID=A0ABD0KCA5_9CAEN